MEQLRFKSGIYLTVCILLAYFLFPGNPLKTAHAEDGNSSTIAGVNVNGLDREEIINVLQDAINTWTTEQIVVTGGGVEIEINSTLLQFNIEETIAEYETLVDKPWFAFWEGDRVVHIPLKIQADESVKGQIENISVWEFDETYNQLLTQASYLKDHKVEAKVKNLSALENERLAFTIEKIPNEIQDLNRVIEVLDNKIINPEEQFSFLETINEIALTTNHMTLNFIASVLYGVVLETEFDILERHQQNEISSYIEVGKDAYINVAAGQDLKFVNSSNNPVVIKAEIEGESLKLEIYSYEKDKSVSVRIDKQTIAPRIIERYSEDLAIGQEKLVQEGTEGYRVNVYRTVSGNGGTEESQISRDYYAPTNRIVLKSSRQPATTTSDGENPDEGNNDNESTNAGNETVTPEKDPDLEIDTDGDGLPDMEIEKPLNNDELPPGSYYDKGGNLITP